MQDKLTRLTDRVLVSEGPTNTGAVITGEGVYLVDSGNDKDAGRKLLKLLRQEGMEPAALINTHSNADHIGANSYLQNQTGCRILASAVEAAFTETPLLEGSFLWGGYPFRELRSKFFNARPSTVTSVIDTATELPGMRVVELPGHFFSQIGILTDDSVFFIGDSIFGRHILEKYSVPFIYDVGAFRDSIELILDTDARFFVPSHGKIEEDIRATAEMNLKRTFEIEESVFDILETGMIFEDLLQRFCGRWKIGLDHGQYVLVGSTVRSFLSYMYDGGRLIYGFDDNRMIWSRA